MKKHIIIFALLLSSINIFAQTDLLMTQQWFSRINKNPAATGNSDNIDLFMLSRFQWLGQDGPWSSVINAHSYYDPIRSGVGLAVNYDQFGIGNTTFNAKVAYAYHINLKDDLLLSLGLSGGFMQKSFDPTNHVLRDLGDPNFPTEKFSELKPDFDFGVELSMPKFLFGGSITHLGRDRNRMTSYTVAQQHYLYARGNFALGSDFDLAPSVVYTNAGKVNMMTFGGMLFYKRTAWFGLDYRPPSPTDMFKQFDYSMLVAMVGVEWNFFRIGYSCDISLGKISKLNGSAHEVMLSFFIPTNRKSNVKFVK